MSLSTAVLVLTIVAGSCSTLDDEVLARSTNSFGIDLLKELSSVHPRENVVLSPSGVSLEVAMVYAGAAGQSAEETSRVLGHTSVGLQDRDTALAHYKKRTNDSGGILNMTNAVLVRSTFKVLESYKKTLRDIFSAEFRSVDFLRDGSTTASEINKWVCAKTQGRVKNSIADGLPMNTVIYVISAVSLPPIPWLSQFEPNNTRLLSFFNHGTKLVKKEVMTLTANVRHARLHDLESESVELLSRSFRFSMVIVLPDSMTGLAKLRATLSITNIDDIDAKLRLERVNLRLPKFSMNKRFSLIPALRRLGMKLVLGAEPDLLNVSGDKGLFVSEIRHIAAMSVSEEGVGFINRTPGWTPNVQRAIRSRPLDFYVDRPFLFYIRDRFNNCVLQIGEVWEL